MRSKAVFLDKDGTLIDDIPYNVDPDLIRLSAGALEALELLQAQGYQLIVVTNQSGVARGYFKEEKLQQVEERLRGLLSSAGIVLSGFYYCPHYPDGEIRQYAIACGCRKPEPGMIYRAALEHQLDLEESWLVGDILNDIEAGNRAGCRTVLVANNHETEWEVTPVRQPAFIVKGLMESAGIIATEGLKRNSRYGEQKQRFNQ
jgi:D-glycero-D-manno-heptose 1,7-bisphosphate phosphatase